LGNYASNLGIYSSNLNIFNSNSINTASTYNSNLNIFNSNLNLWSSNNSISVSNAIYPSVKWSSNNCIPVSNAIYPSVNWSSNNCIPVSNAIYPSVNWSSNNCIPVSNAIYPSVNFSSNIGVWSSNKVVVTSNLIDTHRFGWDIQSKILYTNSNVCVNLSNQIAYQGVSLINNGKLLNKGGFICTTSNLIFGAEVISTSNIYYPSSNIGIISPSGISAEGYPLTFIQTNSIGGVNSDCLYDSNISTSYTLDQYNGLGTYVGTNSTGGKAGNFIGVSSRSPFACVGYKFSCSNITINNLPWVTYTFGSSDNMNWTQLDNNIIATYPIVSTATTYSRQIINKNSYKYYRMVVNSTNGASFIVNEFK
jgi:hypothetical protein